MCPEDSRVEYETIKSEFLDFGKNKFVEISRKRVLPDGVEFLNISRGFYTPEGERRYNRGVGGLPVDKDFVDALVERLRVLFED